MHFEAKIPDSDKILVTGSSGLVGYHIVQALLRRGFPVRALVRSLEKARALLPEDCELLQGDITDQAAVRDAMQVSFLGRHTLLSERFRNCIIDQNTTVRFRSIRADEIKKAADIRSSAVTLLSNFVSSLYSWLDGAFCVFLNVQTNHIIHPNIFLIRYDPFDNADLTTGSITPNT